jgi:hypothetical protein
MRLLPNFKKLTMMVCGALALVAFTSSLANIRLYDRSFMNDREISLAARLDDLKTRELASKQSKKLKKLYFPLSPRNREIIDGHWIIKSFTGIDGLKEEMNISMPLTLIANGEVRIATTPSEVFHLSIVSNNRAILFKNIEGGFEIVEAIKIPKQSISVFKKSESGNKKVKLDTQVQSDKKRSKIADVDLILEKAIHPSKTRKVLSGKQATGLLSMIDGDINNLEVQITYDTGEVQEIEIPFAEINDGGQFHAMFNGKTVNGIFTANGKDTYRLRFATGPMQGVFLNFVTQSRWDLIQEQKERVIDDTVSSNKNRLDEAKRVVQERIAIDKQIDETRFREEVANESANYEYVSPEEMSERLKKAGFNFNSNRPKRKLASKKKKK